MQLERKECGDCGLALPLKQFASYRKVRHPLCRTCLAIDVAEFKEWVLPYVEKRRTLLEPPHFWEDWEIAVLQRMEMSGHQRAALTRRPTRNMQERNASGHRSARYSDPAVIRPWKYSSVGVTVAA